MWCGAHAGLGWVGWTLMSAGMIAFWGLIIWAVISLVRPAGQSGTKVTELRPEDVLANRLARGDISPDEYERARSLLDADRRRAMSDQTEPV